MLVISLMDQYYGRVDYNEHKDESHHAQSSGPEPFLARR